MTDEEKKYIKKKVRVLLARRSRERTPRARASSSLPRSRLIFPSAAFLLPPPPPLVQIRPGAIVLAENETALLVEYELEGQLYAPDGVTVITEKSDGSKKIKVKTLNASTDLAALAAEIVDKCKLIHHSKTPKVEALLRDLRSREEAREPPANDDPPASSPGAASASARRRRALGRSRGDLGPCICAIMICHDERAPGLPFPGRCARVCGERRIHIYMHVPSPLYLPRRNG